ncbi:hypothetical protein ACWEV4_02550 [Streptomyces sp. NPDC003860]
MTNPNPTHAHAPRTALALIGADTARRHLARTALIARQLDAIAPGTVRVRTVPVHTDRDGTPRRATWVTLDNALGQPIEADRAAHRAARGLLRRLLPDADWTRPQVYDATTGDLTIDVPSLPEELRG